MTRRSCPMCRLGRDVRLPLCRRHIQVITRAEYDRETGWLTPDQVVEMKARGFLRPKTKVQPCSAGDGTASAAGTEGGS